MKIKLSYDEKKLLFFIVEDDIIYKIPFAVIFTSGRKLLYYSDKNSTAPVKDWYNKLDEISRQEIFIGKL